MVCIICDDFNPPFSFVAFNEKRPTLGSVAPLLSTSEYADGYPGLVLRCFIANSDGVIGAPSHTGEDREQHP